MIVAISSAITSGFTLDFLTNSSRYLPVLTRMAFMPTAWAPAMSLSKSSPIMAARDAGTPRSRKASSKNVLEGLPIIVAV